MKTAKFIPVLLVFLLLTSCGSRDNKPIHLLKNKAEEALPANIPLDKGFSEYIMGYTSGIVQANSTLEIRFTPEFAAKADKSASGLFIFDPAVKGKTEWRTNILKNLNAATMSFLFF